LISLNNQSDVAGFVENVKDFEFILISQPSDRSNFESLSPSQNPRTQIVRLEKRDFFAPTVAGFAPNSHIKKPNFDYDLCRNMTETIPTSARVIIIGGGVAGTSVAYHLAKMGWKDIRN
jgi:hypothetical protein